MFDKRKILTYHMVVSNVYFSLICTFLEVSILSQLDYYHEHQI